MKDRLDWGFRRQISLLVGRFQPFHNGHKAILESLKGQSPHVVLVTGSKPSKDSPFSVDFRRKLIREVNSDLGIIESTHAYLPDIISEYEDTINRAIQVTNIRAGVDRIEDYIRQCRDFTAKNLGMAYPPFGDTIFCTSKRITSGTEIRDLLRQKRFEEVADRIPVECHKYITDMYLELIAHDEKFPTVSKRGRSSSRSR